MGAPALSILIPTYRRGDLLRATVTALLPQLRGADELLVLDQERPPSGPPPGPAGPALRLEPCWPPSLTRARNRGITLARNPLLLFLDDDIVPPPGLLEAWREAAARHPGALLAGAVEQDDEPALGGVGAVDFADGSIRTNFNFREGGDLPFFGGCHFLLPKALLPPPPWFCPHFRGSAQGEEIDFALRCRALGLRIVGVPEARIRHLKAPSGGCRADAYRRAFPFDQARNAALFFARRCPPANLPGFLRRMRGFVEFHSRSPGGHDPAKVLRAGLELTRGLALGWWGVRRERARDRAWAARRSPN